MSTFINEEQQYISFNSTGSNNSSGNLPSMSKDKYMTTYENFLQWKKCCGPGVECILLDKTANNQTTHRIVSSVFVARNTAMEEYSKFLQNIKVPTSEMSSELIQEVLTTVKRQSGTLQDNKEFLTDVTQVLWHHLQEGLIKFDDQLLCATCFYTVLVSTDKKESYLREILEIIIEEIDIREKHLRTNTKTLQAVSLMYGMFQSSFLTQETTQNNVLTHLLQAAYELLQKMAYEYSKFTFIVFKTINSFKKVCGTELQEIIFSKENQIKLLNVVNHNWENPITGVRDLNKTIFQTLITVMDDETYKNVLQEINGFYWNKAKYLMLAEISSQSDKVLLTITKYDWIDGLMSSLYKPGLVSAGADMYFALFKKINTETDWCKLFIQPIVYLLSGESQKGAENFTNYWLLTTFKRFPILADILLKELEGLSDSENKLHSSLCVIKQANKLGLIKKNWETTDNNYVEKSVLHGLDHINNQIRLMAFDILCKSHCKSLPTKTEYKLVLNFLNNNVNSDCTVLRISMLNSLSSFLMKIHMSYLNHLIGNDENEDLKYLCSKFQDFIVNNIKIRGNYQRKITCIKLADIFLNGLKEVPKKGQKSTRKSVNSIIQMLKDVGKWRMHENEIMFNLIKLLKDPAEDIRENVGQLLLEHYPTEVGKSELINLLIDDALKSMSSKFFYEINCGQSVFKLIINILIKNEQLDATFKNVDDVLNFALKELATEYQLKRETVDSIEKGRQLHSFMSIIQVVLEVTFQKKATLNISNENLITLLEILEGISNQFAWEEESSTSSDFSKISDMVNNIIATSGHSQCDENDQTKISGLHQIVLNCLWLNVKGSCELSSLLIKYQKDEKQIGICEKAFGIICHVLETCRHKGAIEAAGAALGQSIQHLTTLPEKTALSKLPFTFLRSKLLELISEATRMASVTRRGAGLSIMVHRIVSSDAQRGKPLFHYFMKTILETCNKAEDVPSKIISVQNIDNEKDLPKAIYIHFLTRIVTDSSLASDMMFYSADLAELAFGNLTSPYWQIRNAALQLYGALVQKLIGQKKASGIDDETIATVACDELRTHSPKLWNYILDQLKNLNWEDKVQYHSNLVPILNMLANIARRYNFTFDVFEQKQDHIKMLNNLMLLSDSPIYTVRRLTAKCISNLFSFEEIYEILLNQEYFTENYLHGSLMLITIMFKLHYTNEVYKPKLDELETKYAVIFKAKEHSYISKEVFEDTFSDEKFDIRKIGQTLEELNKNSHMPGVFLWTNKRFHKYLLRAPWDMVPELLKIILTQNESETYLTILLDKIENEEHIMQKILLEIIDILLRSKNQFKSSITWKILYKLSLNIEQATLNLEVLDISELWRHFKESGVSYKLRYMIPFAARISVAERDQGNVPMTSKIIGNLTDPETADVEMRYIAAMANNELSLKIKNLPEEVKITIVKSAIILLQDEDEEVRMLAAEFYPKATESKQSLQPYICLCKTMSHNFLDTILSGNGICRLAKELMAYLSKVSSKNVDEYNPFANDSSNIYLEVNIFRQLIENL